MYWPTGHWIRPESAREEWYRSMLRMRETEWETERTRIRIREAPVEFCRENMC